MRVEKYIPEAIKLLERDFGSKIPSSYNGYISSFGASIMQSGLKITIAIFEDMNKNSKQDKSYLTKLIAEILTGEQKSLLRYIINSNEDEEILKQKIIDIAIAIKLAIRTFELEKK